MGNTATSMKIGDFGCSRCTQPDLARLTPNVLGTVQYAAPELINEDLLPPPGGIVVERGWKGEGFFGKEVEEGLRM